MGAVLALFGIFLILPLILTLSGGFESKEGGFTAYHIMEVFRDPLLRAGLVNSLWIAVAVTGLCLVISLPLAFLEARTKYPGQGLLSPLLFVSRAGCDGVHGFRRMTVRAMVTQANSQ